jgi:hypothetical protein
MREAAELVDSLSRHQARFGVLKKASPRIFPENPRPVGAYFVPLL